jgi:hypothetical protein
MGACLLSAAGVLTVVTFVFTLAMPAFAYAMTFTPASGSSRGRFGIPTFWREMGRRCQPGASG